MGSESKRRKLDLRGRACPYPFSKAMLTLEKMKVGEEFEMLVDYPPAVQSTPRQLGAYGHQVVEVRPEQGGWLIVVRKGQAWWG